MSDKDKELLHQVKELHKQILKDSKHSLNRAIRLGSILQKQKEKVGHGHFIKWVNSFLPFSERTSRNYLALNREKDRLKEEKITSLRQAYLLISNCHNHVTTQRREKMKQERKDFASQETTFKNPSSYHNKIICGDCLTVMEKMLKKMKGKYSAVITSPPYNANFDYGNYDDNKPYSDYIDFLLKPFSYYSQLLRTGGRIVYVIGAMVNNSDRSKGGDYNYQLVTDLTYRVREEFPEFKHYNTIVWDKSSRGKNPLNTKFGSFCSPEAPVCRSMHEFIIVWSKGQFELKNVTGENTDLTEEEFKEWTWSIWSLISKNNTPHPCSYPKKLVERLIKLFTYPGDMVLDSFGGIGTTGIVAQGLKRKFTMIELNPNYCKYAKEQLEKS